jgi:fructose-1,6-bisphosphatase II
MDFDIQRLVEFDFLRATEIAALNCMQWIGKGDKEAADAAACDAIRGMFDLTDMRGEVVIGEGIKDEAPGIFKGERLGTWRDDAPRFDIALDPVDGTTNISKGMPNSISCIAAAIPDGSGEPGLQDIPAFYMKKLAYPPPVRKAWIEDPKLPIDVNAPLDEVIRITAKIIGKSIRDVVVMVLDRPRNQGVIEEVRRVGASLRMIADGDISAALAPALNRSTVDLYAGIGGTPEGVLAAAALRCLGGGMQAQIWPRDEAEQQSLIDAGWGDRLDKVYRSRDLARGTEIHFVATGISDSPLLKGVEVHGTTAVTHSVLMRAKSGTVRYLRTEHNLEKKTIHLRSKPNECRI